MINQLSLLVLIVFSPFAFADRPVAVLPADKTVTLGTEVVIEGSALFIEENQTASYRWSLDISPQGFNSQIDNPTNASVRFTADTEGFYLIRLVVNNGTENSYPAYMVIRAVEAQN